MKTWHTPVVGEWTWASAHESTFVSARQSSTASTGAYLADVARQTTARTDLVGLALGERQVYESRTAHFTTYDSTGGVVGADTDSFQSNRFTETTRSYTVTADFSGGTGYTESTRHASLATRSYAHTTSSTTFSWSSVATSEATSTATRIGTTSNSTLAATTTEETFSHTHATSAGTVSTTGTRATTLSTTLAISRTFVPVLAPEDHEVAWQFTGTLSLGSPTQVAATFAQLAEAVTLVSSVASACSSVTQTYTATRFTSVTENVTLSTTVPGTLTQFSFEGFFPMTKTVSRAVELVSTTAATASNSATTTETVSGLGTSSSVSIGARIWSFATAPITVQADVSSSFTTTFQIRYETTSSVSGLYFPVVALSRTSSYTSEPTTTTVYAGSTVTNTSTSSTYAYSTATATSWTPPALAAFQVVVDVCGIPPTVVETFSTTYSAGATRITDSWTITHASPAHTVSYETWTQSSYTTTENQITASGTFTYTSTSFSSTGTTSGGTHLYELNETVVRALTLKAPSCYPFEVPVSEAVASGSAARPSWPNVTAHLRPVMPGVHAPTAAGIADALFANLSASPSFYYPFASTGRRYTRTAAYYAGAIQGTSISTFEHVSPALFTDPVTYSTGSSSYTARFATSDSLLYLTGRTTGTVGTSSTTSTSTTGISVFGSATFSFTEVFPVEWSHARYTSVANPGATNESTFTTSSYTFDGQFHRFSYAKPEFPFLRHYNGRAFSAAGGASPTTAADLNPAFYFAPGVFHLTTADSSASSSFATTLTAPTWSTSLNTLGIAIPEYQPSVYSVFQSHGTYFCFNTNVSGAEVFVGRTTASTGIGRDDAPLGRATFTLSKYPIYETT